MVDPSLANSLLSGLVGGVVVAGLNYVLTRRKTLAEVAKLELEAAKIRQELSTAVANIPAAVGYTLVNAAERLIYATTGRALGHDFAGADAQIWKVVDGKDQAISRHGRGTLTFEPGEVLNIQRANMEGRYEVWLQRYLFGGKELPSIPKDELMEGQRSIRLTCEAKVIGAQHTLRFVLKNEKTNKWPASAERVVTSNTWMPIDIYFQIPPSEECRLRIDDLDVSKAPSSVQIRNLVLAEKTALGSPTGV